MPLRNSPYSQVLVKIATEDTCFYVREKAVDRLTDQTLLYRIATEDTYTLIREKAVDRLTDQTLLCRIAITDEDESVRISATANLTDQMLLMKVAIENKESTVRTAAVANITDQALLIKFATEDTDSNVRAAAVANITDQALLTKFATEDRASVVRAAAVRNITDQELLTKMINKEKKNLDVLCAIINTLKNPNPFLLQMTGNLNNVTLDARECFARVSLAIQDPIIKLHIPNLRCIVEVSKFSSNNNYSQSNHIKTISITNEKVTFKLCQNGTVVTSNTWISESPQTVESINDVIVNNSGVLHISGEDLMERLFQKGIFNSDDLLALSRSDIPEVRIGAVDNLSDKSLLSKISTDDDSYAVRFAATNRLKILSRRR